MTVWLWLTVLFANLADAVAEGRGKAQAATLRASRDTAIARKLDAQGNESRIAAADLKVGDLVVCEAGDIIPGDGDIVEGVASVDESAITGESAPVVRESGGDRSSVTGGTRVLSDRIVIRITTEPGQSFVDRMIALVEGSVRQKTPNEIALNILLASLTIVFLLVIIALQPMSDFAGSPQSIVILVSLLVCLIPTTIGALVSAIGVAGMDRLVQHNVLAMSGRAVEAAGDVSTLLLDKTGTITYGNRQAARLIAAPGVDPRRAWRPPRWPPAWPTTPRKGSRSSSCAAQDYQVDPALGPAAARGRRGHRVLRPHPDERHRPARAGPDAGDRGPSARARSRRSRAGSPTTAARCRRNPWRPPTRSPATAEPRCWSPRTKSGRRPGARRRASQGRRQTRYRGTVRRTAGDGHPHRDDHR